MELFSISCPTCGARLKVRNAAAIGQILNCPKCASMMQVAPPAGWTPPVEAPPTPAPTPAPTSVPANVEVAAPVVVPPPLSSGEFELPPAEPVAPPLPTAPPLQQAAWTSPAEQATRRIITFGAVGGVALVALVGLIVFLFSGDDPPTATPAVAVAAVEEIPTDPEENPELAPQESPPVEDESAPQPLNAPVPDAPPATEPADEPASAAPVAAAPADAPAAPQPPVEAPKAEESNDPKEADDDDANQPGESSPFPSFGGPLPDLDPAAAISNRVNETPATAAGAAAPEADASAPPAAAETIVVRRVPASGDEKPVDVKARLADQVQRIDLPQAPLVDLVRFLTDMTTLPICIDVPALQAANLDLRTPLKVQAKNGAVAELLTAALAPARLTYLTTPTGQIVVTTGAPAREVRLRIDDLAGGDLPATEQFAERLQRLVAPESWTSAGGPGVLRAAPGELTVKHTPAVIQEIVVFCEKLRAARGLPLRSRLDARQFELTTQAQRAAAPLGRQVTFTFHEPTTLPQIARYLETQCGVQLLIDWRSLAHEEFTPATQLTCAIENRTLGDALAAVLPPLNLGWRIVDPQTIEIFSQQDALEKAQREFYPLRTLLAGGAKPDDLVDMLRRETSPKLWQEAGGIGVLVYDRASECLIVLQTQAVHAEVARLLAALEQKLADR